MYTPCTSSYSHLSPVQGALRFVPWEEPEGENSEHLTNVSPLHAAGRSPPITVSVSSGHPSPPSLAENEERGRYVSGTSQALTGESEEADIDAANRHEIMPSTLTRRVHW